MVKLMVNVDEIMFDMQCLHMLHCCRETRVINLKSNSISSMFIEFIETEVERFESYINNEPDNCSVKVYRLWWEAAEMISVNRCCITVTSVRCLKTIPTCKTHFSSCLTM